LESLIRYKPQDTNLIKSKTLLTSFNSVNGDYIDVHIYDANSNLLLSILNTSDYLIESSAVEGGIDTVNVLPEKLLATANITSGRYRLAYNFFRNKIITSPDTPFFIKEISSDRTEIRLGTNLATQEEIELAVNNFITEFTFSAYYKYLTLNLRQDIYPISVNIALDTTTTPYTILLKLYEPLPDQFQVKDQLYLVEEVCDPVLVEVELQEVNIPNQVNILKGPNLAVEITPNISSDTDYANWSDILNNNSQTSYQLLSNNLELAKNARLNIDYTNFSNFIHFSSAEERIQNFLYKVKLIEQYTSELNSYKLVQSSSVTANLNISSSQTKVDNLIKGFDGFESFMYFTSGSPFSYPKRTANKPYALFSYTSSQAITWLGSKDYTDSYYGGMINSGSQYDTSNLDNLQYSIPEYIRNNSDNQSYLLFVSMISQHFDNQWLFTKGITDIYNNNSSVNKGISKDLVFYALKSLGFKLYSGNNNTNIFEYFTGQTNTGNFLPTTGSNQNLIYVNDESISREDITKEIWSRIYHNIPLLLKSKGTERSVRALINSYGIPSTILRINEYGGPELENSSSYNTIDKFNYALNTSGGYIYHDWYVTEQSALRDNDPRYPDTVQIRFKIPNTGSQSIQYILSKYEDNTTNGFDFTIIDVNTTPKAVFSIYTTGSKTELINVPLGTTQNISGLWYNATISRQLTNISPNQYDILYKLDIRNKDFGIVNQKITGSYTFTNVSDTSNEYLAWDDDGRMYIGYNSPNDKYSTIYTQEYRYWSVSNLSNDALNDHTLSPENYNGNTPSSSFYDLQYRLPLGTDLYIYDLNTTSSLYSYQPDNLYQRYTGKQLLPVVSTAVGLSSSSFVTNYEYIHINWPSVGMNRTISNKIRIEESKIDNNVLDISTRGEKSSYDLHPSDSNRLSISLSPTMEIDEDIANQLGGFKIDNYIGDPANEYTNKYEELSDLKDLYYSKYFKSFNTWDYIRLIQYYDTSVFKTLKQLIPERVTLYTGVEIKSDILSRTKIKLSNKPTVTDTYITTSYDMLPNYIGEHNSLPTALIDSHVVPTGLYSSLEGSIDTPFIGSTDDYKGTYDSYKLSNFYLKKSQDNQLKTIVDPLATQKSSIVPFITRILYRFNSRITVLPQVSRIPNIKIPNFVATKGNSSITYETASLQDDYNEFTWYNLNRYDGVKHASDGINIPTDERIGLIPIESYTRNTIIYQGIKAIRDIPNFYEITNCSVDPESSFISPTIARNIPPKAVTYNDIGFILEPDDKPTFLTRTTINNTLKYSGNRSIGKPLTLVSVGYTLIKYVDTVTKSAGGPFYRNNNLTSFVNTPYTFSYTSGSISLKLPFRLGTKSIPRTKYIYPTSSAVTLKPNVGTVATMLTCSFGLYTSTSFFQQGIPKYIPNGIQTGDIITFYTDYVPPATSSLQTAYINTYTTRSVQTSDLFFETQSYYLTGSGYCVIDIPTVPNSSEITNTNIDGSNLPSWYFSNTSILSGYVSGSIIMQYNKYIDTPPQTPVYTSPSASINFESITPPATKISFIVTRSYIETINTGSLGFALGWYKFIPVKDRVKVILPPQYRTLTTITAINTGSTPGTTYISISPSIELTDPTLSDISYSRYKIFRPVRNNTSIIGEYDETPPSSITIDSLSNTFTTPGNGIPVNNVISPTSNTPSSVVSATTDPLPPTIGRILPANLHPDIYNLYMSNGTLLPPSTTTTNIQGNISAVGTTTPTNTPSTTTISTG
jgi:hypothetical protein